MRVELGSHGFCFGVERAVSRIEDLLISGKRVFTDGDIVHNRGVMGRLVELGLTLLDPESIEGKIEGVFVVRAHGLPPSRKRLVEERFEEVVDLTCPIVSKLFETAEKCSKEGRKIVVFGKEGHAEMEALRGHVFDAIVTREPVKVWGKLCVISQTTSPWREYCDFVGKLMLENFGVKDVKVLNTVCEVTVERERDTEELSKSCDLIIIVGGKHSANTEKLYRIASERTKALWVESADEIVAEKLEGVECIGVVSGTSTPAEDVKKVVEKIESGGKGHG